MDRGARWKLIWSTLFQSKLVWIILNQSESVQNCKLVWTSINQSELVWSCPIQSNQLNLVSDQIRSVAQLCLTLCHAMNHSTPGLPVHHQFPEFTQTHPLSRWCHAAISSSVVPFSSCPQSLPASESFPMSQLFTWGGQSTGVSALASFLPKNTQGWSPLESGLSLSELVKWVWSSLDLSELVCISLIWFRLVWSGLIQLDWDWSSMN